MGFSEKLKIARKKMGYTQQFVADKMGITKSTYCGYETGKRQPDVKKIKQLAEILNTTGDELLEINVSSNVETDICETSDINDNVKSALDEIGIYDPKARQIILDYWHLSNADKELFWRFVDKFIKKKS